MAKVKSETKKKPVTKKETKKKEIKDELPTEVTDKVWLWAHRDNDKPIPETELKSKDVGNNLIGKWLIYLSKGYIDEFWIKIKKATEEGLLGIGAKVKTSKSVERSYVICVYTKDYNNEEDVNRVREELKNLGILRPISYKRDIDTFMGNNEGFYRE
jgi:hypothetical protein